MCAQSEEFSNFELECEPRKDESFALFVLFILRREMMCSYKLFAIPDESSVLFLIFLNI